MFFGSSAGWPSFTGPGNPIVTASYAQPADAFLTPATMARAVSRGPEGTLRGAGWPLARILMLFPPTSTTSTFTPHLPARGRRDDPLESSRRAPWGSRENESHRTAHAGAAQPAVAVRV